MIMVIGEKILPFRKCKNQIVWHENSTVHSTLLKLLSIMFTYQNYKTIGEKDFHNIIYSLFS